MSTIHRIFPGMLLVVLAAMALGLAACARPAADAAAPSPPAPAVSAPVRHPFQAADLPPDLGGLHRAGTKTYGTPGHGVSVAYAGPELAATVFLYDAGMRDVPDELGAPVVVKEFEDSLNEVAIWGKVGWAKNVEVLDSYVLEDAGRPEFLCAELGIDAKSRSEDSYLFLATHQGQFVKILTTAAASRDSRARAQGFARSLGRLLWPEAAQ